MTHLAGVADRIDRSYSPCGGREERDLDFMFFKEPCGQEPHANVYSAKHEDRLR
jgi:hypothetical protein